MKKNLCAAILIAGLLAGCGSSEGEGVAQPNSTIQIAPAAVDRTYSGNNIALINAAGGFEDFVTVTVLNASGNPLRDTEVRMFHLGPGSMANTSRVLQNEPYVVRTDDFGNISLFIYTPAVDTVDEFATDFSAFSGSAFQRMTVTLTCIDTDTTTADTCN